MGVSIYPTVDTMTRRNDYDHSDPKAGREGRARQRAQRNLVDVLPELSAEEARKIRLSTQEAQNIFRETMRELIGDEEIKRATRLCWAAQPAQTEKFVEELWERMLPPENPDRHSQPPFELEELVLLLKAPLTDHQLAELFERSMVNYSHDHLKPDEESFFIGLIDHTGADRQTFEAVATELADSLIHPLKQMPHALFLNHRPFLRHPRTREVFLASHHPDLLNTMVHEAPEARERRKAFRKLIEVDPSRALRVLKVLAHPPGRRKNARLGLSEINPEEKPERTLPEWMEQDDLAKLLHEAPPQQRAEALRWARHFQQTPKEESPHSPPSEPSPKR